MKNKQALLRSLNLFKTSLPIMIGVLLLVNLVNPIFQKFYPVIFSGNFGVDSFFGALAGSISFGIPVTSFVVGGELIEQGVSLVAVAAFILAWSTVGVAMLPLEILNLGKKFAVVRNLICFIFSILIAILTVITLNFINIL
ncbi:MAG: hypothetical protein KAQ63_00270 [Candidatus Moranbacteria bacterium]|nr:hypothetical protein [Candidatus Moranbacteria bacterium]